MRGISKPDTTHPEANTQLFADDTSMHAVADSCSEVLDKLVPAMVCFKDVVAHLKLKLSPKAAITANDHKLLTMLVSEITAYGLQFQASKDARDLGISNTAGNTRSSSLSSLDLLHLALAKVKLLNLVGLVA